MWVVAPGLTRWVQKKELLNIRHEDLSEVGEYQAISQGLFAGLLYFRLGPLPQPDFVSFI